MPAMRARTITITSAMLNSVCAATIEPQPRSMPGRLGPDAPAAIALTASRDGGEAISVAMPMTMPGTMSAM